MNELFADLFLNAVCKFKEYFFIDEIQQHALPYTIKQEYIEVVKRMM